MDTSKAKKKTATEKKERECVEVSTVAVSNTRVVAGGKGDVVFFTLMINGVTIYNCRVATGKAGDFISFPQYKGKNDTYYNNVYVALSDKDQKMILDEVQAQINED